MSQSLKKREKKMKKKRKFKSYFISIIILGVISGALVKGFINDQLEPMATGGNFQTEIIEIPKGSTTSSIATLLEEKGLIKSSTFFRLLTKFEKKDGLMKAGKYDLNKGMNPREIINIIVEGDTIDDTIHFTIPEGFELSQIAERLSNQGLVNKERFLELSDNLERFKDEYVFLDKLPKGYNLEGYLFPETYEVYQGSSEEEIIKKMLDQFKRVYEKYILPEQGDQNITLNQLITLASIIEREGKVDAERPLIAAVFYNRLKKGMLLQSCATVQYALGERKEILTYDDLKIESKYNTYIYSGLPPSPIASPGLQSVLAALRPADANYLYFVSNGDGTHTFTTNLKDHVRAKND